MQAEPWLQRDRAMIDPLRSLGIQKGRRFEPNTATQAILDAAAREAHAWLDERVEAGLAPPVGSLAQLPTGQDAPTIAQRRINSTVVVKNGETIGLGGLIRDSASAGRDGLPYLSGLPVIGPLFGTRTTDVRRTELLILLRPRIVQTTQDARDMTNELRSRMQGLLPVVHREP